MQTPPPLPASTDLLQGGLSVVIPAFNEEDLIARCLRQLREQLDAVSPPVTYELIVCDNNSTDQTAQRAQSEGAHVVFEPHNQIARARNTGAQAARFDWLLFVDADSVPGPELIPETIRLIRAGQTGAGGAVVHFEAGDLRPFAAVVVKIWNAISSTGGLAAGSYLFCKKNDWQETGGFDQTLYAGEEIWFSQALKARCKRHSLQFVILRSHHILTSARKLRWYRDHQLFALFLLVFRPWKLKSRTACRFWYDRPASPP